MHPHSRTHRYYHSLFFLTHSAPTDIYSLSLHDALPIFGRQPLQLRLLLRCCRCINACVIRRAEFSGQFTVMLARVFPCRACNLRSEEHTSELQSLTNLVCRLLLEKKTHTHTADSDSKIL